MNMPGITVIIDDHHDKSVIIDSIDATIFQLMKTRAYLEKQQRDKAFIRFCFTGKFE